MKTKRKAVSPEASAIGRALSAIKMQKTTPQQRRRSARTAAAAKWVAYQTAQAQKALQ